MAAQVTMDEWRWWLTEPGTGRRVQSAQHMTEAQARALDRTAQPVRGSHRARQLGAPHPLSPEVLPLAEAS
jgi:hypothetical protein